MNSDVIERVVRVAVNTIENIITRDPTTIKILIYHDDILIGESEPLNIEPDYREPPTQHRIDYSTNFRIIVSDRKNFEASISSPLIIQIVEHDGATENSRPVSASTGDEKKRDKPKSGRKSTGLTKELKILGICNVDVVPIILGEKNIVEKLIIQEAKESNTLVETSWLNLPILTITLSQEEENFLPPEFRVNYSNITIESIYNPPLYFTGSTEYKAATIIPMDTEEPEVVIFEGGKFVEHRDVELIKKWQSLSKVEGRGKLSNYKIDCNYEDVKNPLENIDVKKIIEADDPRIEWNYMSRHALFPADEESLKIKLNKYRFWPFQFQILPSISNNGKNKSKDSKPHIYQCYADFSELLCPGRTQARTIAQLYPYNLPEMVEKTGFSKIFFNDVIVEEKKIEKKGKLSTKGSSINLGPMELESNSPLFNESGLPVFVVVQFELREPLLAARKTEELTSELYDLIGPPDKLPFYPYTGDFATEQYTHCIRKIVATILESYQDFNEEEEKGKKISSDSKISQSGEIPEYKYSYIPDEIDRFTQYLYDTGIYIAAETSLRKKILRLLDQKFKTSSNIADSEDCQNFVANAYLYLVERMHVALNSESDNYYDDETLDYGRNFYLYAEECFELGYEERAKDNYLEMIARKRNDPEAWLNYAIFSKKIGDLEKTVECCKEAVNLDRRNKLALLLYGVILAEKKNYSAAEVFLKATTELYPRFAEAWGILHLFFLRTEYFPGIDLTFRLTEQCLRDGDRDIIRMDCLENEPLAWTTVHCSQNRIYLILTVFLLKLNLFDFAGIALAQELSLTGRSTSWLYYMAVHHYLLGRYEDALSHLKEAQNNYGRDYSISALMGHCYLKEENDVSAKESYEFASTFFNRPQNIHLVELRMGYFALDSKEYNGAKKKFLNICKNSPTCNSWLGLGISCFEMMDLNDAEIALAEANRLDHKKPEVWAYLCLLNMSLQRYEEFTETYRQTVKNDLQDAKLWLRIRNTMESLGLPSPMLQIEETREVEELSEEMSSVLQ